MANGFIKINGQKVPYPDSGLKLIISTLTNGGRNKNGKVTLNVLAVIKTRLIAFNGKF